VNEQKVADRGVTATAAEESATRLHADTSLDHLTVTLAM
jgi:hypothetical protein